MPEDAELLVAPLRGARFQGIRATGRECALFLREFRNLDDERAKIVLTLPSERLAVSLGSNPSLHVLRAQRGELLLESFGETIGGILDVRHVARV